MEKHPTTLGEYVQQRRLERGLTQIDLAEAVDMSQRWVSDLERGVIKTIKPRMLRNVADALGVRPEDLVLAAQLATTEAGAQRIIETVPATNPLDSPALRASFSHIPDLSDENLDKVAAYIEDLYRLQELGEFQNTKAGTRRRQD
ncbi:MAG: helix-turn-helix transcriptional regulator [Thermomicrobiales bacterium]